MSFPYSARILSGFITLKRRPTSKMHCGGVWVCVWGGGCAVCVGGWGGQAEGAAVVFVVCARRACLESGSRERGARAQHTCTRARPPTIHTAHLEQLGVVRKLLVGDELLPRAVVLRDQQAREDRAQVFDLRRHARLLAAPRQDVDLVGFFFWMGRGRVVVVG